MLKQVAVKDGRQRERFEDWLRSVEQAFQVSAAFVGQPARRFTGVVHTHAIGRLTLISVTGSAYSANHARNGGTDQVAVLLAMRGTTRLAQPTFEVAINTGEFCVFDTTAPSSAIIATPFHNVVLRLPRADLEAALPAWRRCIGQVISARSGAGALFFEFTRALLRHGGALEPQAAAGAAAAATSLLSSALLTLPAMLFPSPTQMEHYHRTRIRSFVRDHLRDPELDVVMVARELELSPRHIHRLFHDQPQHLMHWVWSERLRLCHDDLCRPHLRHRTVAQIAYSWGFNDPAHFSRTFRQRFGVAPSALRGHTLPR